MGLLERALKYKKQLNESGRETLIDKIKGPAEPGFIELNNSEKISSLEVDEYSIRENDSGNDDAVIINDESSISTDEEFTLTNIEDKSDDEIVLIERVEDEDILLFDNDLPDSDFLKTNPVHPADSSVEKDEPFNQSKTETGLGVQTDNSDTAENAENLSLQTIKVEGDESFTMPEFNDYAVLYEILKEFIQSDSVEEIYSTIIFSVMGQLGVSSASILAPSEEDPEKWIIIQSSGIRIPESEFVWEVSHGILEVLNNYRGVIDVEDIKDDIALRDDYYRFISVDARIIAPIIFSDKLSGVILVGEKLDSENFTPPEIDFLNSISETASSAIRAISAYEKADTELLGLRIEKEILDDVEILQNSLLAAGSVSELEDIIRRNFYSLGIETYSIFLEEPITGDFYPAYFENDDNLSLSDSGFRIKRDNRLVAFLFNKRASIILENFVESNVIIDTFGRGRVDKMSVFISYPFIISGRLSGFITIFKINPAVEIIDVDIRMHRIVRFIFPYLYRLIDLDPEKNIHVDLTGSFYARLESEINKASDMNIPLSIISLSVKNYKRFYDRFGKIETVRMFDTLAGIIKGRLYSGDFSARVERNKFLIILPGKDKKYSATFSAILKNEIAERFNTTEFKLLVTFISAVFPEDGRDIFSILEILD